MSGERVLVTGATGKVGRAAVGELLARGAQVRAFVRDPSAAGLPPEVEIVRGDIGAPSTFGPAFEGVDKVFLVWPGLDPVVAKPFVDLLPGHVVYLSARGVREGVADQGDMITNFHASMERMIAAAGVPWTFLRADGFAGNTLGWAADIRAEGVVRQPFGAMSRALVHERDLAAAGALALTEPGHEGKRYVLTGPRALTQIEQAAAIGAALGRPVRFEEVPAEEAASVLLPGLPREDADRIVAAWASMAAAPEPPTPTVSELLGRPALSFEQWARDHVADFR